MQGNVLARQALYHLSHSPQSPVKDSLESLQSILLYGYVRVYLITRLLVIHHLGFCNYESCYSDHPCIHMYTFYIYSTIIYLEPIICTSHYSRCWNSFLSWVRDRKNFLWEETHDKQERFFR
jgi:hypothetical protein